MGGCRARLGKSALWALPPPPPPSSTPPPPPPPSCPRPPPHSPPPPLPLILLLLLLFLGPELGPKHARTAAYLRSLGDERSWWWRREGRCGERAIATIATPPSSTTPNDLAEATTSCHDCHEHYCRSSLRGMKGFSITHRRETSRGRVSRDFY